MKTKMISGLSMLAFNDINKPHRKFHLHYVICSAPQVAREASDIERAERGTGNEKGGERKSLNVKMYLHFKLKCGHWWVLLHRLL